MSQALAKQVAQRRGAELLPVMATIEAETNFRNVLGEYAAWSAKFGLGFGQVHLRWHFATLQKVARELNITLPSQNNPMHDDQKNEPFRRLILGNDTLSMHLAVAVIDRIWRKTGTFETFQRKYVGARISERDLSRRRRIWEKWEEKLDTPAVVTPAPVPEPKYEKIGVAMVALVGLLVASLALPPDK